ncbi:hypothetical protein PHLH3_07560 [Pseudomonas sp. St386]|nr:hypothetical protein DFO59_11283 [Pseudomonas fluorescens]BBP51130.1 hypothetical protein PHLH3_07560 [Pseudomonas sp. St386]
MVAFSAAMQKANITSVIIHQWPWRDFQDMNSDGRNP